MTFAQLFEDHLKLAVRVGARRPLRSGSKEAPSSWLLNEELDALEARKHFERVRRSHGFEYDEAKYAVDALIDQVASDAFGMNLTAQGWVRRNQDPKVGHNFYHRVATIADGGSKSRTDLLEIYLLCELLGFRGDNNAKSDKVRTAFSAILEESAATNFKVAWEPLSVASRFDLKILSSQHLLRNTLMVLFVCYSAVLLILWLSWIAFPRS